MPYAIVLGVNDKEFWDMSPRLLEPYEKAHEMREEIYDTHLWQLGQYIGSAVSCVLADKKQNIKYIEKPFHTSMREQKEIMSMTDDEKKQRTELFFKSLISMQNNFEKVNEGVL